MLKLVGNFDLLTAVYIDGAYNSGQWQNFNTFLR